MTIQIELKPEEELVFLERARQCGRDPARYAQQIIRDHIGNPTGETGLAKPTLDDLIDHEFVAACAQPNGGDVPTIEEVRKMLASVLDSLSEDVIADREDRF
jgi:hypothetical protein